MISPARLSARLLNIALAAIALLVYALPVFAEDPPPQSDLVTAGNGSILWFADGTFDAEQRSFVQRLAYLERAATQPRTLRIAPQIGRIRTAAAVGDGLSVFYNTGLHVRYTPHGDRREIQLPGRAVPLAMSGYLEQKRPVLLAVIKSEVAAELDAATTDSAPAAEAEESRSLDAPPATRPAIAPGGLHLIRYDSISWTPVTSVPEEAVGATWLGLASDGERTTLAWRNNPLDDMVEIAWLQNEQWTRGPALDLGGPPADRPTLGLINRHLVLAAMLESEAPGRDWRCATWFFHPPNDTSAARWDPGGAFKNADGKPLTLPPGSAMTGIVESLAVVRRAGEEVEYGLWSPSGGEPLSTFATVPLIYTPSGPGATQNLIGVVTLVALLLILTLLFRHRPESLSEPIPLPPGIVLAGIARRLVAAVIDMAPAAALVMLIWHQGFTTWYAQANVPGDEGDPYLPPLPLGLVIARVIFVLLYTAWCTAFELAWQTTPGKRLLGCSVISEKDEPLTRRQILIRNLTRIVELEPYLNIWPFALVTVITRNRQRAGDILARTLVVERRPITAAADHDDSTSSAD